MTVSLCVLFIGVFGALNLGEEKLRIIFFREKKCQNLQEATDV